MYGEVFFGFGSDKLGGGTSCGSGCFGVQCRHRFAKSSVVFSFWFLSVVIVSVFGDFVDGEPGYRRGVGGSVFYSLCTTP